MFILLDALPAFALPVRRRAWTPVAIMLLSTMIESFQGLFLPERVADPRDVLANSLGAVLGS